MKELSIEEKAKRYDEALKVLHKYDGINIMFSQSLKEEMFPELKEKSEDERIRKGLIQYFGTFTLDTFAGLDPKKILSWPEAQGEQKSAFEMKSAEESLGVDSDTYNKIVDECIYGEQKPIDKVEPKFKVGDWVTHNTANFVFKIINVGSYGYEVVNRENYKKTIPFDNEDNYHLWTIQDAKDGDVLCCESGWTCIFKTLNSDNISFSSYCFMDNTGWFCETGSECHTLDKVFIKAYNGEIHPATKEQCDLLFQKMKEAGYEWNAEKKELKKIESTNIPESFERYVEHLLSLSDGEGHGRPAKVKEVSAELFELAKLEQNPAWSEEDEIWIDRACMLLDELNHLSTLTLAKIPSNVNDIISHLKSLKDRVQPQPKQEWKQENTGDLTDFENAMMHIGGSFFGDNAGLDPNDTNAIKEQANLLLELVPKKWSEEDSRILYNVKAYIGYAAGQRGVKDELFIEANEWLNSLPIGFICNKNYNEDMVTLLVGELKQIANDNNAPLQYQGEINWLKSLRPQNTWKPSERQLECLGYAIEKAEKDWSPLTNNRIYLTLKALKEQLEKL